MFWATVVVLALVYGWWAVSLPSFSAEATVAVLGAGGAASLVGLRRPARRGPARTAGAAWWAAVAAAAACWQLLAYLQQPRAEHPTLSSLTNALLDTQPARAAAFALWIAGAVELARR